MDVTAPAEVPNRSDSRDAGSDGGARIPRSFWVRCAVAVAIRPGLWGAALRMWARSVPVGWWRERPYWPRPDRDFLAFRFETAYGTTGTPEVRDFLAYLRWIAARS